MKALIDYCSFTCATVPMDEILRGLSLVTGEKVSAAQLPHGGHGFTECLQVRVFSAGFDMVPLCRIYYGGQNQRGRVLVQMSGEGCGSVSRWDAMRAWLETLPDLRLTRVDLAVDLYDGEYTVDDCRTWYEEGKFITQGRRPISNTAGDWISAERGRTLYVGKAANGKMLRCYEKGKEQGDLDSAWTRFEVQFGNRDRVIPLDILTDPDKYFVGAYPALEQILEAAGERIKTIQNDTAISIAHCLTHLRRTYGPVVHTLAEAGVDITELVRGVSVKKLPRRLTTSAVVAGVMSDTIKRSFSQWRHQRV